LRLLIQPTMPQLDPNYNPYAIDNPDFQLPPSYGELLTRYAAHPAGLKEPISSYDNLLGRYMADNSKYDTQPDGPPVQYEGPGFNPPPTKTGTISPYDPTYDTAPSSAMNIGQILAGIGYGNSSQPAPTMAPMTPGMTGAAGTGSDLASLLRRYYGK
jgi:hypothetical protein